MEVLFNNSTLFIFFFAMLAIFNYTNLKVHQRIAIIYLTVYALVVSGIIGIRMAFVFLFITVFCYLEIFTADQMKFKIISNPFYKLIDCLYLSFCQYYFLPELIAVGCHYYKLELWFGKYALLFKLASIIFFIIAIIKTLQQKFVVASFDNMYKVFLDFPINRVKFNDKLRDACKILVAIEDRTYFTRKGYTTLSRDHLRYLAKKKWRNKKLVERIELGKTFISNVVLGNRGYSTLPMQLIRTIGVKQGYNCRYRRKLFEFIYSKMFFDGFAKYLKQEHVQKRKHIKEYYLYIYFHTAPTYLKDATFTKFLNAFDMQYRNKNKIDIYDCSNEGIFIACMGLKKSAHKINEDTVEYYTGQVTDVELDKDKICEMVSKMMDKPYNGNYLC